MRRNVGRQRFDSDGIEALEQDSAQVVHGRSFADEDERHIGSHLLRQRHLIEIDMYYRVVQYVALDLSHDDRPRRSLSLDAQRQDGVSFQPLQRMGESHGVDLDGLRFYAMSIDVGRRDALSS